MVQEGENGLQSLAVVKTVQNAQKSAIFWHSRHIALLAKFESMFQKITQLLSIALLALTNHPYRNRSFYNGKNNPLDQ